MLGGRAHTFGTMEDAINFFSSWLEPTEEEVLRQRTSDEHVRRDERKSSTHYHVEIKNNETDDTITSHNMKSLPPRSVRRKSEFTPDQILRKHSSSMPAKQTLAEGNDFYDIAVVSDYPIPEQESSSSLPTREKHSEIDQEDKPTMSGKTRKSSHSDLPPVKEVVSKRRLSDLEPVKEVVPKSLPPVKEADPNRSEFCISSKRMDSTKSSRTDEKMPDEEGYIPLDHPIHFSWMPFGRARTGSAVFVTLLGLILAILSKRSLQFVKLQEPLDMSPHFAGITNVGMVRLKLCYTSEYLESLQFGDSSVSMPYLNGAVDVDESAHRDPCFILSLSTAIIEDTMWDVSRLSTSMAIAMGAFFCIMMISTIRWESINMKPIAIGLLITYLFQSFSFFFYDSRLCRQHSCKLGAGTYLSILASFCWFAAAMIAILMDVHHTKKIRRLARREWRRRRRLERRMKRKTTTSTELTQTSSTQDSSSVHFDKGPLPAVITEKHLDEGILWQV